VATRWWLDVRKGVELSPIENNARRSRRNGTQSGRETDRNERRERRRRRRRRRRGGADGQAGEGGGGGGGWSRWGCTRGCILWGAANSVPLRSITTSGVITELPTAR